jgi:beta-glucosidase
MMKLGLFETPYTDPEQALAIANDKTSQERADLAHRKSIVLMRNDNNLLPLTDEKAENIRLYVERFPAGENNTLTNQLKETIRQTDPNITIVDQLSEATHAFVWVLPMQNIMKRSPSIMIDALSGIPNVNRIIEIQQTVPTITAINFSSPWIINVIEPNASAVIGTFGVKTESLMDVIRGRFNPTGKLPFTIPASAEAVHNERGDVPGFDEDPSYVYKAKSGDEYIYNFGLSYSEEQRRTRIGEFFRKIFGRDSNE